MGKEYEKEYIYMCISVCIYTYIHMHACPVSLVSDSFRFYELSCQAPLTMGFSRQESWSGLPLPTPEMFLTQRSNPYLLHWQADSLPLCYLESSPHPHPTHTQTHTCMLSHFCCVRLFEILWTIALQLSLSMGFSRQE